MVDLGRRPLGRLCYWALAVIAICGLGHRAYGAGPVPQNNPATTTVADTVYRADGIAAQGNLIITWPSFTTASGTAVGSGSTNVKLGANGALSVGLVPNAGATPAGVYYSVIYQLGPGEVRTEYWIVPTTSPANLAAVRATPGSGVAGQPVSMQYVNSELATKANDSAVVHLNGTETITGAKTFAAAPTVPAPTSSGQVATKGYVDSSVANVGAGNYLPTVGGTMTGPITLPANPAAPMQASNKQYVDTGLASKADVISGLVPVNELGTGLANSSSCLLGNGTWGACGTGSGSGNVSTNPTANQVIAQPGGTQFAINNLANIRYVTASWNWAQTPADNLSTPGTLTIHLSPCPLGLDTAAPSNYYSYKVYIAGTGTAEAAPVIGGNCAPGTSSGTITVTTAYAHAAGYTVGSASTGIQEAWNDAWTNDSGSGAAAQTGPYVKLAADQQYNVFASIYLRGRGGVLDGAGALIACSTRDRCIFVGTTQGYPWVNHHKLYNLSGASTLNVDGVQVASVSAASGIYTITTASAHPFVVGDTVDCEHHSQTTDAHWSTPVLSVPNSTSFTISLGHSTVAAGTATFGWCNLLNTFIENNSDHVVAQDINIFQSNPAAYGYFSYGIVNDNDQQFIVERASNRSSLFVKNSANWPLGAFLYQRTDQGNAGITYVHDSEFTGINCATGGGNGMVVSDTVCQGFPAYGIRYFGGYQPATFQNIYEESTGGSVNPLYGYAAQAGYVIQGGEGTKIGGTFPLNGYSPVFALGGGTGAERTYFVVPRSSAQGYGPVLFIGSAEPASGSVSIPLVWPSVDLENSVGQSVGTLTWDVLVTMGGYAQVPMGTGTWAIATNISASCGTNGMCSFTDTQAGATSYAVTAQQFTPVFWFWPVNLVINNTVLLADQIGADPSAVASQGTTGVSIVADECRSGGVSWRRSPIWVSCLAGEISGGAGTIATVLQEQDAANNGPAANSKGRLNFGKPIVQPNDLVTLQDSNFTKTMAAAGERPSNDAGDMALGVDQAGGLAERAATSITSYINALPSGTNYQERLTAAAKTFNVPVTVNGNLAVSGGTVTLPVTGASVQCLHVSATGVLSGTGADCGSGGGGGMVYPPSGIAVSNASGWVASLTAPASALVGVSDAQTLTNKTVDGVSPATMGFLDATSSVQSQLSAKAPLANPSFTGNASVAGNLTVGGTITSAGTGALQFTGNYGALTAPGTNQSAFGFGALGHLQVAINGSSTLSDVAIAQTCGSHSWLKAVDQLGSGGNCGQPAVADVAGAAPISSPTFTGTVTMAALSGTSASFSGNVTVGGQIIGTGPWSVSGPVPGVTIAPAASTSQAAFDSNGILTVSENGGAVLAVAKLSAPLTSKTAVGTDANGHLVDASGAVLGDSGANGMVARTAAGTTVARNISVGSSNLTITNPGGVGGNPTIDVSTGNLFASPTLTGTVTVPTATAQTSTTQAASTAFVMASLIAASSPFIPFPGYNSGNQAVFPTSSNTGALYGFIVPVAVTTSKVIYKTGNAADSTANTYEVGIYNSAGTLVLHYAAAGTSFAAAINTKYVQSWAEGSVTLPPGKYYEAITTNCASSCANFWGSSTTTATFYSNNAFAVTPGGTLASSITAPGGGYESFGGNVLSVILEP